MTDRTDGYVTDVSYTADYCRELNPLRMKLALLHAGVRAPEISTACELGFGHGVSLNIHAAASSTQWYGTDINAAHAGFARQLATVSGTGIGIFDEAFDDFTSRPDLPDFDYIGLHGVWSWISDRNRAVIVDFVRRKLRQGGVLYIDYNALPGWSAFSPMRHLFVEHANRAGTHDRRTLDRVDDAVAFVERLLAVDPDYARDDSRIRDHFKELRGEDGRYLAHEYFNRDWLPMHFATVAEWLKPALVDYAGSANFADHLDVIRLTEKQRGLLEETADPVFRQSVRDFIINRRFRHDFWIKGTTMLAAPERDEALRKLRVVLATPSPELPFKLRVAMTLNRINFGETVCMPILELLADGQARSLDEIEQAIGHGGICLAQIADAVMLLASLDHVVAAQDATVAAAARPRTDRLNAHLLKRAYTSNDIDALASPVTGGGVWVRRAQQIFLSALHQGRTRPDTWVDEASKVMLPKQTDSSLADEARVFAAEKLPLLRALQIA